MLKWKIARDALFTCLIGAVLFSSHHQHRRIEGLQNLLEAQHLKQVDTLSQIKAQLSDNIEQLKKTHTALEHQMKDQHQSLLKMIRKNQEMNSLLEAEIHASQDAFESKLKSQVQLKDMLHEKMKEKTRASDYRIFGLQSYGMVVKTPYGYKIARVGQPLGDLGIVTMVTEDKVIVNDYVITKSR